MPQFFIDAAMAPGKQVQIRGADARHILKSLRLRQGDWIVLSDGSGRSFRAEIAAAGTASLTATIEAELPRREGAPAPTLAIALIHRERFEWALQKAVELGCRRILPFGSARSEPLEGASERVERWSRIATEAAKQSGLPFLPKVEEPIALAELCEGLARYAPRLLLYEGECRQGLRAVAAALRCPEDPSEHGEALVIIGPEGGFTDAEVALARASGALTVSLGRQILRVETAAVTAIAILQYELGNLDLA